MHIHTHPSQLIQHCRTGGCNSPSIGGRGANSTSKRGRGAAILSLTVILLFAISGSADDSPSPQRSAAPNPQSAGDDGRLFTETTATLGLNDTPEPWQDGTYRMPEMTGGGVALFDYDNDGDLDLLQLRFPPPGQPDAPAPNRLFQQGADGTFLDVTAAAGIGDPGYGQGAAVGDADNDGDLDVYVTNYGPDAFYRNNGDGTFTDATEAAGVAGDHWSSSAAFVDYDRDGALDLYVVHYVKFYASNKCSNPKGIPEYCGPQNFEGVPDALYRNNGDGVFTDVSEKANITLPGKGLGVVCADLTGDGWVDFYVANDGEVNQLWVNNRDGSFTDEAVMRGVGFNGNGLPEASMGVAAGDINGDGQFDLFMTHLRDETNTLYLAGEYGMFTDASEPSGLAAIALPYTGFGCGFFDADNDGDLDLALANGRVKRGATLVGAEGVGAFWSRYAERNLLFENEGEGRFRDVSGRGGGFTGRVEVSRGLAFGDIDRDGDLDLAVGNLNGVRVFRNDAPPPENHWLRVRPMTRNRDAIGAVVTVVTGDRRLVRLAHPGGSYLSSSDPGAHFGLGTVERISGIEVAWPDGSRERFDAPGVDREVVVRQGEGEAL